MKNRLTCDINRRTYMSYGARQRCSRGGAAQSGSHPPAPACALARSIRTFGPRVVRHEAPSLSLPPARPATQTIRSGGRCQGVFYGQAFLSFSRKAEGICRLHGSDAERDCQPSGAGGAAAWGRPWLTAGQAGHARCGGNINWIGCQGRSWLRFMPVWCPSRVRSQAGQLGPGPEASRRY